jgi:hypothetical protein
LSLFEIFLQARQLKCCVMLELSPFMSLLTIVETHGNIRAGESPLKVPEVELHQFWHQRQRSAAGGISGAPALRGCA